MLLFAVDDQSSRASMRRSITIRDEGVSTMTRTESLGLTVRPRALIYCRVSSSGQGDNFSLETQE